MTATVFEAPSPTTVSTPTPAPVRAPGLTAAPRPPKSFDVDCTLTYQINLPTDFLFQIHAMHGMDQEVLSESLDVSQKIALHVYEDPSVHHRFLRLHAEPGTLELHYKARIRRNPPQRDPNAREMSIAELPDNLLHNLMSTRYCESDHLGHAAFKIFGKLPPGYARVQAICDWIYENVDYQIGSSQATTTARDVFLNRAGVCRDFAHLGVTFCRALNIPARLVVGYARFAEPPPDFHAVFEAYLGGRWVLFDPTRMSPVDELIRIATGRDAKDVAFATIFGAASMTSMNPAIDAVA
jgi:transglutaminase-like putative cysteine protease